MDAFQQAEQKYLKDVERRARAQRMSVEQYLETKTTLLDDKKHDVPAPAVHRAPSLNVLEDRAREAHRAIELKAEPPLPVEDAILDVVVREPKGVFRLRIEIPKVGEILLNGLRNERGYKDKLLEGLAYALYGIIKE